MPAHHAAQPPSLLRDGLIPACSSWSLTSRNFARSRFEIVIRRTQKRPSLILAQMCVKPRKSNVSGLPSPRAATRGREATELDQARLVRVQLQ